MTVGKGYSHSKDGDRR